MAACTVTAGGRVVAITKHNKDRGALVPMLWQVAYDPAGQIVGLVDPQGYPRQYEYDTLGRRRVVRDPNAGMLSLSYDDAGNLVRRVDAAGREVLMEYGAANRLLARHLVGGEVGDGSYLFHYDTANAPAFPQARALLGRLAWLEGPVGTEYWSYDEQGRVEEEVHELWDPYRSGESQQQRDRFVSRLRYDPQGKVTSGEYPGGLRLGYGYNARSLLGSL